jgi:hypothetical protein
MAHPFMPSVTIGSDQKSFFTNDEICGLLVDTFDQIWKKFKGFDYKSDSVIQVNQT